MSDEKNKKTDEGLQGNEKIESAVAALQREPSEEMLAHTLTVIRRRMKEGGQLIVDVEPSVAGAVTSEDGQTWWTAFTSFEEEVKGSGSVMSTFLSDMEELFTAAVSENGISGVIINPWNRTIMLDKMLLKIILGRDV